MATSLDNRPDEQTDNPIQDDYDNRLNASPDDKAKTHDNVNLSERETNPDASDGSTLDPWEQAQLDQMEAGLREGHLYQPEEGNQERKTKLTVRQKWSRVALGAGIAGGVGAIIGFLFFFLPAFRSAHLINNIEQRFMGVAANAIEQRAERLFSRYVRERVFPLAKTCRTIIEPGCSAPYDPGQGYASRLYTNWSNAQVEQKLFTDKGLRVEYNRGTNKYTIFRANGVGVDFNGPDFELSDFDGQDATRNQLRQEIRKILKEVSLWDRIMLRGPVRRLAKTKWNIRWCFFACDTRDNIRDSAFETSQKIKLKLIERTISPFSERLGVYFTCAVSDCTHTEYLRERSATLTKAIESLAPGELDTILDDLKSNNRRLSQFLVEKILTNVFGKTTGKAGAAAIPIIGWIYAIDAVNQIDIKLYEGAVSEFLADNTASQYAEAYLNLRVHYDEAIDGQLNLDEVGAQSQLFEGVEGSLVYQREFGNGSVSPAATAEQYLCADGEPIPEGELVCEERKVGKTSAYDSWRQSEFAIGLSNTLLGAYRCGPTITGSVNLNPDYCSPGSPEDVDCSFPFLCKIDTGIHFVFSQIDNILEVIGSVIIGAIKLVPGGDAIINWFQDQLGALLQFVLELVFPFLQAGVGPGNQVFDDIYAGGDVVGNEFSKGAEDPLSGELHGLGGVRLSDDEVQDNLTYSNRIRDEEFANLSLFDRLFSTSQSSSLVSIAAQHAPLGKSIAEIPKDLLAFLNPLKLSSLSMATWSRPVIAQQSYVYQGDPFDIDQYGYPVDDPVFDIDPETITEAACIPGGEIYEHWKEGIIGDDSGEQTENGQIIQSNPNPCMLELTTVNVLGSWFTSDDDGGL